MADAASDIGNLRLQAKGENLGTWGDPNLNRVIDQLSQMAKGVSVISATGSRPLTSTNYVENEYRKAVLWFDGTGPLSAVATFSVPAQENQWLVVNDEAYAVSIWVGSGDVATVPAGRTCLVWTDGTDTFVFDPVAATAASAATATAQAVIATAQAAIATTKAAEAAASALQAGPLIFISASTLSNTAAASFTLTGATSYRLALENVVPATDGADLELLLSIDGSSYNVTIDGNRVQEGSGTDIADTTTGANIFDDVGSGTNEWGVSGFIDIIAPAAAAYTAVKGELTGKTANVGNVHSVQFGAEGETTTAVSHAQLAFSSGNMESGTIRLYGLKGA